MDSRPSELDPYPRAQRDLGSALLWDRSLHRSHRRRMRVRDARRNAPRQKGATLAAGAAILASPVLTVVSAASASSARPGVTKTEVAQKAALDDRGSTALLSFGDTGEAVASVQHELAIVEDGIFGPQTEGAVKDFQLRQGFAATGIVDASTWAALFRSRVQFYDAPATGAAEPDSSENVVFEGTAPEASEAPAVGAPDVEERVEPREDIVDAESPEATIQRPAVTQPAPVSTGGSGCTADGRAVAPVNGTVTGGFGDDRGSHAHSGTDIAAPTGTTVRAAQCGTVSMSGTQSSSNEA